MNGIEIMTTASLGDTSYLLVNGDEAALVDPQRDSWGLMESCTSRGVRIRYVLETHVHNDYVSGALEVRAATDATVAGPASAPYAFDHLPLVEDDEIVVGDLTVRAMETPGHTAEHTSYLVFDDTRLAPTAVFTGGSLLVGGAGRTDLSGDDRTEVAGQSAVPFAAATFAAAGRHPGAADARSRQLLRGRTLVSGQDHHHGRRAAYQPHADHPGREEVRQPTVVGPGAVPRLLPLHGTDHRSGPEVLGGPPTLRALTPSVMEGLVGGGAQIVDGRDRRTFAAAHLPGSLCDEPTDRFAGLVGEVVPFGTRLVLVLPEPAASAADEAVIQLLRIGYENVAGNLSGGVDAWQAAGRPLRSFRTADVLEPAGHIAERLVLDVRPERPEGGIPGTIAVPLAELPRRLGEMPREREIWTVCGSGRRATVAASLLDRVGIPVTAVVSGGVGDLTAHA